MSSQISTWKVRPFTSTAWNSRSVPEERLVVANPDGGVLNVLDVTAGGVPAALVELPVVRKVRLRDDAEDLAAVDDHRTVVEPVALGQRRADNEHRHEFDGCGDQCLDRVLDGIEQDVLQHEVVDGVTGEAELREHREADVVLM